MVDAEKKEHQLKRVLGPWQLISLGVGAVGSGEVGVHGAGDVDQRRVRRDLLPVEGGERHGEAGPQLPLGHVP